MTYRTRTDDGEGCFALIAFAVVLLIVAGIGIAKVNSSHEETLKIQNKERVCDGGKSGSCRYLLWTDQGVYENTDSMLAGKWDSSDVQGKLNIGHTYAVEVRGWRIPFFSSYPNIVEIHREVAQ